ncbi:MAG TPA: DinB family protein, partial [Longimicrobium sp.]|nr:DinB family protein [Longimicrobium sp.]
MADLPRDVVLRSILTLLAEGFEGPEDPKHTWFVNNEAGCGVFGTLDRLSAAEASREPGPGRSTAAAHAEHLRFSLDLYTRFVRGEKVRVDWAESWETQTVDAARWDTLRAGLRREYDAFVRAVGELADPVPPLVLTGLMGCGAHTAYHLGALRQIA